MSTIDYYNKNAKAFFDRTIAVDMSEDQEMFLQHLPQDPRILDAGCGSGRDGKYFKNRGCNVFAIDASVEMVKCAQSLGINSQHLYFHEMNFQEEFDGVWANASLLHIPYEQLRLILEKIHKGLKYNGIFYASFKYGTYSRAVEEREFYDMDETKCLPYLEGLFAPIQIWKTADKRSQVAPSPAQAWLKILAKKITT